MTRKNKLTAILLSALMMGAGALSAHAQEMQISSGTYFGCTNEKDFDDIVGFTSQGDDVAAKKLLSFGIAMGACTVFKQGEKVFVVDNGFSVVKLRRKGETTGYWTYREAMK